MKVLIACEFSGRVSAAFRALGHTAYSCDVIPCELKSGLAWHLQCDVRNVINDEWDLMIAHPPCTYLATSGARWFKDRVREQLNALDFVRLLLNAPINKIAIENPKGVISSQIRRPNQIIQPHWFGEPTYKETHLWLKNLSPLKPTNILKGPNTIREWKCWNSIHRASPGAERGKERSRTYIGVARAMAEQWGNA